MALSKTYYVEFQGYTWVYHEEAKPEFLKYSDIIWSLFTHYIDKDLVAFFLIF